MDNSAPPICANIVAIPPTSRGRTDHGPRAASKGQAEEEACTSNPAAQSSVRHKRHKEEADKYWHFVPKVPLCFSAATSPFRISK